MWPFWDIDIICSNFIRQTAISSPEKSLLTSCGSIWYGITALSIAFLFHFFFALPPLLLCSGHLLPHFPYSRAVNRPPQSKYKLRSPKAAWSSLHSISNPLISVDCTSEKKKWHHEREVSRDYSWSCDSITSRNSVFPTTPHNRNRHKDTANEFYSNAQP